MEEVKESFKDYTSLFVWNALGMAAGFVNMFLMSRFLGAAGFGTFNMLLLVVNLAFTFAVNWTNSSILRFGKEEHLQTGRLNIAFWTRTAMLAPCLVIGLSAIFIFRDRISDYAKVAGGIFLFVPALFLVQTFSDCLKYMFQSVRGIRQYSFITFLEKFLVLAFILLFVKLPFSNKLPAVAAAYCAGFFLAPAIVGLRFPWRAIIPPAITRDQFRRMSIFSYPILIGSVGMYVSNWADLMVINQYGSRAEVGIYALAYRLMTVAQQFVMLVIPLTLPLIIAFRSAKNEDAVKRYMRRFVPQGIFFWSLTLCVGVMLCRWLVPRVFGATFEGAGGPLSLLFAALGMNLLSCFLSCMVVSYELILPQQALGIVAAGVNVAVDLLLVPRIGMTGAAIGTLCGYTVTGVGTLFLAARIHHSFTVNQLVPISLIWAVAAMSFFVHHFIFYPLAVIAMAVCVILLQKTFRLFTSGDEEFLERISMPEKVRRVAAGVFAGLARI